MGVSPNLTDFRMDFFTHLCLPEQRSTEQNVLYVVLILAVLLFTCKDTKK